MRIDFLLNIARFKYSYAFFGIKATGKNEMISNRGLRVEKNCSDLNSNCNESG